MTDDGTTTDVWQPDHDGPAWLVTLHWSLISGRYEPVGIELRSFTRDEDERIHFGRERLGDRRVPTRDETTGIVTSTLLRSLPIGRYIQRGIVGSVQPGGWEGPEADDVRERLEAGRPPGRGGRPAQYSAEHWTEVARVYAKAWAHGDPPTKAVAERGPGAPVSKSTAAKWVARCRALGLLPQTSKGRASARKDDT